MAKTERKNPWQKSLVVLSTEVNEIIERTFQEPNLSIVHMTVTVILDFCLFHYSVFTPYVNVND